MSDVFISYARSTAKQAQAVAAALRALGYSVWIDDDLPAHRTYSRVIEEQIASAKAAVVIWSADAVQSEWVMSEANRAREDRKLVQVITDKARLPMPFDTIQCADLSGWTGDLQAPGWRKVVASIADLVGGQASAPAPLADAPLPLPSKPSIAVMPFANLSGDPEQNYFADGMVLEIAAALSRFRSIFVIAGGSTLPFKGRAVSPQDVGRQLGVRYVLEGSVRKAGARVRIGVQLMDANDGAQVWADRFEGALDDVFALQDAVAQSAAGVIEPTIQTAEVRRAIKRPTDNMGSYDLYLRALPKYVSIEKSGVTEALQLLNQAIELDPEFGAALGLAATCEGLVVSYGWSEDPDSRLRKAIELNHRAVKAAGDDAQVVAGAAITRTYFELDPQGAVALIDRAVALNPGSEFVWLSSGIVRLVLGQTEQAVEHLELSMRLAPSGPRRGIQINCMAMARFQQRRFEDCIVLMREFTQESAASPLGHAFLAASYGLLGQRKAATEALVKYQNLTRAPIEDWAARMLHDPSQRQLFLDGIALAGSPS
ncbi:MAG TPA: TIR domain-containing protein [Caulobacteraceae bacterium]|nr:TIR domain-containing protein [Caulobacteraceae bacterium]